MHLKVDMYNSLKNQNSESGNSLVEMLLFTPLAVLFLFVVTDLGFALWQKSAVVNAVRSGLNTDRLYLPDTLTSFATTGDINLDLAAADNFTKKIAEEVGQNIIRARSKSGAKDFKVEVKLVRLNIDSSSGQIVSHDLINESIFPANSSFDIRQTVPDFNYVPLDNFLEKLLNKEMSMQPSSYALSIGSAFVGNLPTESSRRFLSSSLLLAVDVTALSSGLTSEASKSILGKFYALQEQQVSRLRTQIS